MLEAAPESLDIGAAAQALAEGVHLGSYQFLKYKGDAPASKLTRVVVLGRTNAKVKAGLARGSRVAAAVRWARDLVNEPAGAKSPEEVANLAKEVARRSGLKVKVLAGEQLARERMGGVIGVGQGSERLPRFVRLEYAPAGAKQTVAFVGKGVVFDSGGLSIKTASGMETMKTDMSGGAAVIAAMSALKDLGVKTRVLGYVPLVENMPSGTAIRPGDVLKMRNGKTVEVLNTDAEGRLILADALSLRGRGEAGCDRRPRDAHRRVSSSRSVTRSRASWAATKVGSSRSTTLPAASSEAVWHLPLPQEYRKSLESEVADVRNIGTGGYGGALTAGLFLKEFVADVPWAHLDIAGPARAGGDDGYIVKGGTGFGVRTLIELADSFSKPDGKPKA